MFQFNFNVDCENDTTAEVIESPVVWLPAQRHKLTPHHYLSSKGDDIKELIIGKTKIRYLSESTALKTLEQEKGDENNLSSVLKKHTDVVPAVYEGGMTVWECTFDLLHYLKDLDMNFKNKRVLELGCGAALPAIYCMLHGAHITVQDYNEEVINFLTIPNVALNYFKTNDTNSSTNVDPTETLSRKAAFYSGDWAAVDQLLSSQQSCETNKEDNVTNAAYNEFDIILTSETIYNPSCHKKLVNLMIAHLKEDGIILVAAKTHYFGVGGGTQQFTDLIKTYDELQVESITSNNLGLKREIIKINFKGK